jgi:magnesium transporter
MGKRVPRRRRSHKAGLPPGSLIHIGEEKLEKAEVTLTTYDEHNYQERVGVEVAECHPDRVIQGGVKWVNVIGLHDIGVLETLGQAYGLHVLTMEDILNTDQRPKLEAFDDYIFVVLKMLQPERGRELIEGEQISMVLGRDFLLTFQEREGDVFGVVRQRLREAKGKIRKHGADYLAYALIDATVDHYFLVLEDVEGTIENLETDLFRELDSDVFRAIRLTKRDLIYLRRSVWPLREVIGGLQKEESGLMRDSTQIYLRDVYDHTIQVIDTIESLRDLLSGILELYLSSLSNRMNNIMKVLTLIATIFIPLSFIAGVYGMNFEYMPELKWRWGYPVVWGIMLGLGLLMLTYFKKKKWI